MGHSEDSIELHLKQSKKSSLPECCRPRERNPRVLTGKWATCCRRQLIWEQANAHRIRPVGGVTVVPEEGDSAFTISFFFFFLGTSARDLTFYLDFRHRRSFLWQMSTPMRTATFCCASTLVKSCLSPALNLAVLHRLMSLHCSQNRCYAVICDTQTPLHQCKWRYVQQPKTHCVEKVLYEVIKKTQFHLVWLNKPICDSQFGPVWF